MNIIVLNDKLEHDSIFDSFESLIWTDRFYEYGDFEIYAAIADANLKNLKNGYYLWNPNSEHQMIIESRRSDTDVENGSKMIITGRSLESILTRRIIWTQTVITGNFQNGVKKLLNENLINPSDPDRKIDNFIFEDSTDPRITELKLDAQFTGDNLYDAISVCCEYLGIGFKVTINDKNQMVFKLYAGKDRSWNQDTNPYVVFSPKFENLINSNYIDSVQDYKNVTLVGGEGEGKDRRFVTVTANIPIEGNEEGLKPKGLDRRETFTDARHISSNNGQISDADYNAQLAQEGANTLVEYSNVHYFDGQVESQYVFVYGKDFFMGDIVQIADEYGNQSASRITEFIFSYSPSGIEAYPTFSNID